MYTHCCPACGCLFQSEVNALTVCPPCHIRRVQQLRDTEARYPSAEQLGLKGSSGPPPRELAQPGFATGDSCGRRVSRKSEPMGG